MYIYLLERKDPFLLECSENDCYPCASSNENPGKTLNCRKTEFVVKSAVEIVAR